MKPIVIIIALILGLAVNAGAGITDDLCPKGYSPFWIQNSPQYTCLRAETTGPSPIYKEGNSDIDTAELLSILERSREELTYLSTECERHGNVNLCGASSKRPNKLLQDIEAMIERMK
jgi:hypothetical protein